MNQSIYIEERTLPDTAMTTLAADIALHLYARQFNGTVVVVADEPFLLLRIVRKQWLKLLRTVQRERSKTLNALRIAELSRAISHMEELQFAIKTPADHPRARVFFVRPGKLAASFQPLTTLYFTVPAVHSQLEEYQPYVEKDGLVVTYRVLPATKAKPQKKASRPVF